MGPRLIYVRGADSHFHSQYKTKIMRQKLQWMKLCLLLYIKLATATLDPASYKSLGTIAVIGTDVHSMQYSYSKLVLWMFLWVTTPLHTSRWCALILGEQIEDWTLLAIHRDFISAGLDIYSTGTKDKVMKFLIVVVSSLIYKLPVWNWKGLTLDMLNIVHALLIMQTKTYLYCFYTV